jgi:hypothetical protein
MKVAFKLLIANFKTLNYYPALSIPMQMNSCVSQEDRLNSKRSSTTTSFCGIGITEGKSTTI